MKAFVAFLLRLDPIAWIAAAAFVLLFLLLTAAIECQSCLLS